MIGKAGAVWRGGEARSDQVTLSDPLSVVLSSMCKLADAAAQGYVCCVLLSDRGHTKLQQAIAPGLPPAYRHILDRQSVRWPHKGAPNEKPETVVAQLMADFQQGSRLLALASGVTFAQCWPILSLTGETLGVLAVYQRERNREAPFHPGLARQLTDIASNAIEWTRREQAARTSAAILERAQRLSSTGGFSWQPTTNELIWSEELCRIFEFDPAEPVSLERVLARVHPEDRLLVDAMLERARRDGGDVDCEHRLQMPNHAVKHLRVVAYEARNHFGTVQYIGAVQDVTQRRQSETALDKLRSELAHVARATSLGALTASIAHEVNQPLAGVMTNVNTCLRGLASDPPNLDYARESARLAMRDCQRAANVITRLRALLCKQRATTELIDLNEAAREVIALLNGELQRRGAIVQADLAGDLPPIAGDRVQLQQVILNLLLNAAEAMSDINDRPRQLTIRSEPDADDRVRLSVRDTGVGFNPQDVERLFDAFYTTKNGGMGIGLSVSRSIVECHHGLLLARPNDGPGATFSFSIPVAPRGAHG
jgi:signal transduction histidine kinase